ncbi:MAG TPA: aminomethyl-transferring glycine dehydrogenase subunit GcvPB, partial [Burkholderiales bacterium]|nr:aminomethyl-transferring glycine dehydrogenase subunit GcvPB [Burkholderiales bacterium]
MLIFELSRAGRRAAAQIPAAADAPCEIPRERLRARPPLLPEVSELDAVRHYTALSQKNFSVDTHFYPLGSCTMKYNPRACNAVALLPQFLARHPAAPEETGQGFLACLHELQEILREVTGMAAVSLAPMAGAQGEFAGVAMIRAYHESRGEAQRTEILVPDAAHGTNPASAVMGGYTVREIPTDAEGNVELAALKAAVGPRTAGLMLTNPSTLGVFERHILEIAEIVHGAGGLLYYDGANLNAILGWVKPGDMGFDVIHVNLHKTFATPHGGGGPGAGPVAAAAALEPFLPLPRIARRDGAYRLLDERDCPRSIGRLGAHLGNAGVLLRAYAYARMLGAQGMRRVAQYATLNANYLMAELVRAGFEVAFPRRRAGHELIVTLKRLKEETGVSAM